MQVCKKSNACPRKLKFSAIKTPQILLLEVKKLAVYLYLLGFLQAL